jgi:hypothetical protein
MGLWNKFKKPEREAAAAKVPDPEQFRSGRVYDYSTPESRVVTAEWLFQQAKNERTGKEAEWIKHNDYYNFKHDAVQEMVDAMQDMELPWTPAVVPDCFVMVESQIVPEVPQPEFRGRDDDQDGTKAKERELAVRYFMEANRINDMNTANERRLRKLGDAIWKAYYDETMRLGRERGNIRIKDVSVEDFYPDPTAGAEGLQAGEYCVYIYVMHKLRFWRMYHEELEKQGKTLEDVMGTQYRFEDGILEPYTAGSAARDDLVQIMEFWFRQPADVDGVRAGAIGCTIQAGGVELRYIPDYWKTTRFDQFPFVHYWCIRDETQFWNKSELEPIIPMVDAADRQLAFAQLNDAMTAADIIVKEKGALAKGCEITNVPGSVWEVEQGRINGVARLGGLASGGRMLNSVSWMLDQIQRTNRNYDTNTGKESARITTASGLLQLRTDAESQQKLKKADRNAGFERLYELLDYLALEFFDEDRMLYIGAKKKGEDPKSLVFNRDNYGITERELKDPVSGEVVREARTYFPRVDVTVTAGDGLSRSPAATLEVLDKLAATPVTQDNWKLLAEELEYLDIPQKQTIVDEWKRKFEPIVPPELIAELEKNPALLEMVGDMVLAAMDVDGETAEQPAAQLPAEGAPSAVEALMQGAPQEPMGFGGGQPAGLPMM